MLTRRSFSMGQRLRAASLAVLTVALAVTTAGPALAGAPRGGGEDAALPAVVQPPKKCAQASLTAGWQDFDLVIATAVALAESGCDPKAKSTNPPTKDCPRGSTDRGAFQINSCYHSEVTDECAYDLECNAGSAYQIWAEDGGSFQQWTVYTQRTFKTRLTEARKAVKKITGENFVVGIVTTVDDVPLSVHKKPNTTSKILRTLDGQAVINIDCQIKGEKVHSTVFDYDTKIWDKVGPGYVSDGYVFTDSSGWVGRRC